MTQRMRRRLLVAATLAAAGLTGTVRVDAMQGGKLKIALVLKSMSDPFTVAMLNAAQNYQKHYASQFALTIRGTATEDDTAVQIRMVDELIKARMNAIVIAPTDSKALTAVVARGVKAGIIIITIDNPLDDDTGSFSFRSESQKMTLVWIANPFADAEEEAADAAPEEIR